MNNEEERALREQLARLLQEHRDLDAAIEALVTSPGSDLIQVQRLKKRKLVLRDKIRRIEDQLTPTLSRSRTPVSVHSSHRTAAGNLAPSSSRVHGLIGGCDHVGRDRSSARGATRTPAVTSIRTLPCRSDIGDLRSRSRAFVVARGPSRRHIRTPNPSPPIRPTMSDARTWPISSRATALSSASPAPWP